MHDDRKNELTPKLRFPEFRGDWVVDKLSDVADFVNEKTSLESIKLNDYVSTENLISDFGGVTTAFRLPSTSSATRFRSHDVLVSNIRPYLKKIWVSDRDGGVSNDVIVIRAKSPILSNFLSYVLKNDTFIDYVMRGAKGVKMPRGDINLMREYPVPRPSHSEQQKIADCLASLDDVINAQGRKVDALKSHKKGLMQQLFPFEGEVVPRFRFPEFRTKWKSKKIGALLQETPRPIDLEDDKEYSLVTVKRRYGGVVIREVLRGKSIKVKSQFVVKANDFLISKRQIVHDACGLVPPNLEGSIVSNEYSVLTPKEGCDIEFFKYFSQQPSVSESFLQSSVGIVIEKMLFKLNSWLNLEFLFPSFEEQQRIALCMKYCEVQIIAESKKLATLKAHKNGLMQQLFPSQEAGI